MMKNTALHIVLLLMLLSACDQQADPLEELEMPPDTQRLQECHAQRMWTQTSLREMLAGEWRWFYTVNYFSSGPPASTLDRNTIVTIKPDSTLQIEEAGTVTQTTHWTLNTVSDDAFRIETDPFTPLVLGHVVLCDSIVMFGNSFVDGDDNYFVRTSVSYPDIAP